jgi:hypothetical protein
MKLKDVIANLSAADRQSRFMSFLRTTGFCCSFTRAHIFILNRFTKLSSDTGWLLSRALNLQ